MGVATRRISSAQGFNRVLNTPRPVCILFFFRALPRLRAGLRLLRAGRLEASLDSQPGTGLCKYAEAP